MKKELHPIWSIIIYPLAMIWAMIHYFKKIIVDAIAFIFFWLLTLKIGKENKKKCSCCGGEYPVSDFYAGIYCSGCCEVYFN